MLISQLSKAFTAASLLLIISLKAGSTQDLDYGSAYTEIYVGEASDAVAAHKMVLNRHVAAYVKNYIKKNNELLSDVRKKSESPFKVMDNVFTSYNLPIELKYLAVIESELNPRAVSPVGAVGTWQLMPATAEILGLKVTRKNDERTHLRKSTVAAAKYLRDLYNEFGDWLLVMAAYNGGPGPVYAAIKKSGSRNFYNLQYFLPAESREHVKKYIATHYYFEGRPGITTLTKIETYHYAKAMAQMAKSNELTKL